MAISAGVQFVRPELFKLLPTYILIRDCLEKIVKLKGDIYLPRPDSDDTSALNTTRYDDYKKRAVFYDVTSRTLNGLVGQVFTNAPQVNLPELIKPLEEDVNGAGISIEQHAKMTVSLNCSMGRAGLFIDYPKTQGTVTRKQLLDGDIKATINSYAADAIVNWQWKLRGSKRIPSLVVLLEKYQHQLDEFVFEERIQYRVLRLTDLSNLDGTITSDVYRMQIWREVLVDPERQPGIKEFRNIQNEEVIPLDSKGNTLNELPFVFVGAINNDMEPDTPPLETLANLNIAHYRNSADYEESVYTVGQPTYVVTGLTEMWLKTQLKGVVKVGSRTGIPLPTGADAKILQVAPNTMAKEAMDQKEAQMKAIGAKLIEVGTVAKTATEAEIVNTTETSFLATVANNVTEAYMEALRWCCVFTGATPADDMFELNTDFAVKKMSAQERTELVSEWVQQAITFTEMRRGLRDSGVAILDDTAALAELAADKAKKDAQAVSQAAAMAAAVPPTPPVGNIPSGGA